MKLQGALFAVIVVMILSMTLFARDRRYQKILGLWEFSAPAAPQPYESGNLSLKVVDQKLTGEFIIQGQAMSIAKISYESDTLYLNFEVENTPIALKLRLKDGLMEGTTNTPDGPVNVKVKPTPKHIKKNTK